MYTYHVTSKFLKTPINTDRFGLANYKTPMPVIKKSAKATLVRSKALKTPMPAHKKSVQKAAQPETYSQLQGPAKGKSSPSRPRTASPRPLARHARHARHETKTKTNTKRSPGFGGVITVLAPSNLRSRAQAPAQGAAGPGPARPLQPPGPGLGLGP